MKMFTLKKRVISVFLAVLMGITALTPALTAFAGGVVGYYEIQLFYDNGIIVPTEDSEGVTHIEYMQEGQTLQLKYQFVDCELPDNGYIKWYSETPTLVDVDSNGKVKAFDSSKGAVVQSWIDNEVKTIPLVGKLMGAALEKALFNEYVDLDSMDTEEIVKVVEDAFGSDSLLSKYIDSYKGELIDSLRTYLDNINSNVHVTMYDSEDNVLADDYVQICVTKTDSVWANLLPNGTHITNKANIETTVAKGSETQIYACTTPTRLHMGVVYTVKSSSIFTQGNVVATVNDSGLVSFKNTGTVTIMVSPDTEEFINNLLKLINYFYTLENTGTINSDKIAGILIDYVGIDMNRNVLAGILDVCFAIYDIAGDAADPVQLTATAVKIISNIVLQFVYNDTITFTVVDGVPCTDFKISGATSVQEGSQIALAVTNAKPVAADTSDITWQSSDPTVAYVDEKTGVITGRDAGGSLGSLSQNTAVITATSAANNIQKEFTITVTGKTGRYLSDAEILANTAVNIDDEQDLTYNIYPKRVSSAGNLYLTWGLITEGTDLDSYQYVWASEPYDETITAEDGTESTVSHDGTVTDGIGKIDKDGHYTAVAGGTAKVALKAATGYYLSNGKFFEISSVIGVVDIFNGQPVTDINLSAIDVTSGGTLTTKDVTINGVTYHYATVKKTVADAYNQNGVVAKATVLPDNATNKTVKWTSENKNFALSDQDNAANTIKAKMNAAVEYADSTNIYAVSQDGEVMSDVLTVCVTRNYATGNTIDSDSISLTNGKTADATHTMTFSGSWTGGAYACYDCNWYSSNEDVFTVRNKNDDNNNAVLTGVDVGTATLYCVSADGGIVDTAEVTVYPDKQTLKEIVKLCENTVIKRTTENKSLYKDFSKKLDYTYYVLYDEPLASQDTVNTYAQELLYAFYKLGGYIGINGVTITDKNDNALGTHLSVNVTTTSYKNTTYDLDSLLSPKTAMYKSVVWQSSNSSVIVDKNGKCTPSSNDPCTAVITCTATDYMDSVFTDTITIAFAKTNVTGLSLDKNTVVGAKVGEVTSLKATVSPTGTLGVGAASLTNIDWTSSDETVATVDSSGNVTAKYGGDCIITATTCDGGYVATCSFNVVTNYDALQGQIDTYKDLNLTSTNYYPDTWEKYQTAITDSEAMIKANVATQPQVDAMLETLVASYKGLEKYTFINQVEIYLDGEPSSEFYQYDLSLLSEGISYTNAKLDLNVRLYPNNASYADIVWTSSTDEIAILENGVASPASNKTCYGQITCTVTDHYGNSWSDSVWVSFAYYIVTGVTLSDTSIAGAIGESKQLTATIEPTGSSLLHVGAASIKDYYWESQNNDVATIDENGLVTFTGTGATTVRAISYDGGIYGECNVSTTGDRNALNAAIALYKDTNYMDFEYSYGMAFKAAYENAVAVLDNAGMTQAQIDSATEQLTTAGEALTGHEITKVSTVAMNWTSYKGSSQKATGTVSTDTNCISINMKDGGYNSLHYNNSISLLASALPVGADAKTVSWSADSTKNMSSSVTDNKITLTPTKTADDSYAIVTATITDSYGRTYQRTVTVIMAWNIVSGVSLDKTSLTTFATDSPTQLTANVSTTGSTDFKTVFWTSSNEAVATVDANGLVTPVEIGTTTITATTFDGGYKATCNVTVNANYSTLESKYATYDSLINDVIDDYVYTPESLAVLQETVAGAKSMIEAYRSTQAEINAQVEVMDAAYNALVKYIIADSVSITTDTQAQNNVTIPNEKYIRYTNSTTVNGKIVQLSAVTTPDGGIYKSIEWSSSNANITVDQTGLVTNNSASSGYSTITCKITTATNLVYTDSVCVSFVRYGVESISFSDALIHGATGETVTLKPTVKSSALVSNLALSTCTYKSSDTSVATVDEKGVVTFVSQGSAIITATSCDGGYTATVEAYTTWDFTALKEAVDQASTITYTNYAYDYGTAFKTAYDNAAVVLNDYTSTQDAIDTACYNLTTAKSALAGNEFVLPGDISITSNGARVTDGSTLVIDDNSSVTLNASWAGGAMIKSSAWSTPTISNATAVQNGSSLVITKTNLDTIASATVVMTLVDDYDREYLKSVTIKLVNEKLVINDFAITYNGEEVSEINYSCGGVYSGKTVALGVNTYPEDAGAYKSIAFSSSNSKLPVSSSGVISTSGIMNSSSYSTVITVTVTLDDDTTLTKTISVTFTRA